MTLRRIFAGLVVFGLALVFCEFPYEPTVEPAPVTGSGGGPVNTNVIIKNVNTGKQICNASISQDGVNYPGGMLFLNFQGEQIMDTTGVPGFTSPAAEHDRLTIVDQSNKVAWFMMRDELAVKGHIQDPEWSTHPDYLVCLGDKPGSSNSAAYSGYVVKVSDKSYIEFNNGTLNSISTPHAWISETAPVTAAAAPTSQYDADGNIDKASVAAFFGTDSVKVVYSKVEGKLRLYYIDYAESVPKAIALAKPEGKENWHLESALISPDGKWIVYNCFEKLSYYESYIQKLEVGSVPVLVAQNASDPHWWIKPGTSSLFVIFARSPDYFVKEKLDDETLLQSGAAGKTFYQRVELSNTLPGPIAVDIVGEPSVLLNLPFKGGYSRDGVYLCTGYANGYILKFNR